MDIVVCILVLADVDGTSVVTSLAEATSFCSGPSISNVDVLGHSVRLQTALSLYRRKQWIGNVLSGHSACSANDAGAGFHIGTGYDPAIVYHGVLATAGEVEIDVVVVVLVRVLKGLALLLHNSVEGIGRAHVDKAITRSVVLRLHSDDVLLA